MFEPIFVPKGWKDAALRFWINRRVMVFFPSSFADKEDFIRGPMEINIFKLKGPGNLPPRIPKCWQVMLVLNKAYGLGK